MFLLLFIISSSHSFFLNPIRVFKYSNHHFLGRLTPRYNILFTALEPLSHHPIYELPTYLFTGWLLLILIFWLVLIASQKV